MNVQRAPSVHAAIRTLSEDERQRVFAWFTHLENWENDAHTRKISGQTADKDVFNLNTSDDINIFFRLDAAKNEIAILDIAKLSRFAAAGATSA
ncbi:MAG TPA: hypothetical protein VHR66_13485 [Gemmataceae bacterium]|nr:hypothetical protein [Gemmataceae bacterium]